MKFDRHLMRFVILALVLAAMAAVVVFFMKPKQSSDKKTKSKSKSGDWTVYGTKSCGWTNKQLENMDDKGISYTFVDCANGNCDGIDGYPTLKHRDGTVKVGYTQM
jgi:hypothetical protein